MPSHGSRARFGALLREWRRSRGLSQERLALQSEVSARHVSFIETGRAQPSRSMVLVLASTLDLPLRERNVLLGAAGFAPIYRESSLDLEPDGPLRKILDLILAQQEPYPAVALTSRWDLVQLNQGAARLFAHFLEPPVDPLVAGNAVHALLHPRGLRSSVVNFDEVAAALIDRMEREVRISPDPEPVRELLDRVLAYPGISAPEPGSGMLEAAPDVCIHVHLRKGEADLRLFATLSTLGTPIDVAAQELHVESYFPADEATRRWLRAQARVGPHGPTAPDEPEPAGGTRTGLS